jgi:N-acetylneuraminic acid mutarotase
VRQPLDRRLLSLTVRRTVSILSALAVSAIAGGCGGSAAPATVSTGARVRSPSQHRPSGGATEVPASRPSVLTYRPLYSLPAPLRDPAFVPLGSSRFALIGGLSEGDTSTSEVYVGDLTHVTQAATLAIAQHDAQGALLDGKVYVFGGGSFSELDHIIRFDPASKAVTTVGTLPSAQSDVAVTPIGNTAYVVGGYDGISWKRTILAYTPGAAATRVVGTLPVGLRYAAVTAVGGRVLIAGGSTPTGASRAIFSFDPATGSVMRIGTLPQPVTHGELAALGGFAYLVGGRGNGASSQTAQIFAINPTDGRIAAAGRLPTALSDAGLLPTGSGLLVVGGLESSGAVGDSVGELTPTR